MSMNEFLKQMSGKNAAEWSAELQAKFEANANAFAARAAAARAAREVMA